MAREAGATGRGSRLVLPLALFFATFAWSFTYVSLPFSPLHASGREAGPIRSLRGERPGFAGRAVGGELGPPSTAPT
jgi:hypothetical protein